DGTDSGSLLRLGKIFSNVSSLPEKSGMLVDALEDFRLFGEQQFRLVLAGGHRSEVGGFPLVVEHCFKERRSSRQHRLGSRPIVGPEQRVEMPFEFFLVQRLESIHPVRAKITVHRAGKKNCELSEQFGVVGKSSGRKTIKVVEVTRMVTVDHGFRLSGKQLFDCENEVPARCGI